VEEEDRWGCYGSGRASVFRQVLYEPVSIPELFGVLAATNDLLFYLVSESDS
jgi:hypothetical protein